MLSLAATTRAVAVAVRIQGRCHRRPFLSARLSSGPHRRSHSPRGRRHKPAGKRGKRGVPARMARPKSSTDTEELVFGVYPVLGALMARRRTITEVVLQESLFDHVAVEQFNTWVKAERKHHARSTVPSGGTAPNDMLQVCQQLSNSFTRSDGSRRQKISRILEASIEWRLPIRLRSRKWMDNRTGNAVHQGVLVEASRLDFEDFDLSRHDGVDGASAPAQVWLALDNVTDPQNFGALLRSAAFLGIKGVVVSERNSAPLSASTSKSSAGAMEYTPVHAVRNLSNWLQEVRGAGWKALGAAVGTASGGDERNQTVVPQIDIQDYEHDGAKPVVLVLGSEGDGLRPNVRRQCDSFVHVSPQHTRDGVCVTNLGLDSLNVSVAGGILMYKLTEALQARDDARENADATNLQ